MMSNGVFLLVVLAIGLCLAYYVDRLKSRGGSGEGDAKEARQRSRWLTFWYLGRFPSKEEEDEEEKKDRRGE